METPHVHKLSDLLNHHVEKEKIIEDQKVWTRGGNQQAERVMHVADWCAGQWPGDLVHITCQVDTISRSLGAVARKHGRRLAIMLPWREDAVSPIRPCKGSDLLLIEEHDIRNIRRIEAYQDIVDLTKGRSKFSPPATICFAIIDPVSDCQAAMYDIGLVQSARIIAVNQSLWQAQIMRGLLASGYAQCRGAIQHPLCREGYLLPPII